MTTQTLQAVVTQMQNRNYVPPISDFCLGRTLYRNGYKRIECVNDTQRRGYDHAEATCESMYWLSMMQAVN